MATIGIYDYDFFNYEQVIPNLECAKLVTYYRNHNEIALLAPALNPTRYTKFFVRKEYDDGIYPRELFFPNCEYGGRAFSPQKYLPLDPRIEKVIPNMHIYDKYADHFGRTQTQINFAYRIINSAHIRLAPDSQTLGDISDYQKYFEGRPTGIILHDYDLASLNPFDLIYELQNQRHFVCRPNDINPYPVGNKYPIKIYDSKELDKWLKLVAMPRTFFLEYYGLMDDNTLYTLCEENKRMARQLYYNIVYGCSSENEFLMDRLPKIFIQTLFSRNRNVKILLTYNEDFFVTKELKMLVELLNCFLSFSWQENFLPVTQTLYCFCRNNAKLHYTNWAFKHVTVSIEDCRDIFQYIRENNYTLFKMFYELDAIKFKGGKFVDGWEEC